MGKDIDLGDYIDVPARIAEFRGKYPDGSLQPANLAQPFTVLDVAGQTYIAVVAAAYRTPDDPRPGVGMAYEVFPGRTPYTKGSELQNAETSAWGRAIIAALAADAKRGIATAEEVRNRRAEQDAPAEAAQQWAPDAQLAYETVVKAANCADPDVLRNVQAWAVNNGTAAVDVTARVLPNWRTTAGLHLDATLTLGAWLVACARWAADTGKAITGPAVADMNGHSVPDGDGVVTG
jgi:hypothetical protein